MDFTVFKALNALARGSDLREDLASFLALDAQFFFVALLALLFLARGKWRSRNARHGVVAAGLSAGLALAVAQLLAAMWDRPRPYLAHPGSAHLYIAPSHDPSFPSDHATAAFAIAVSILLRHRLAGWLSLGLACMLAVARVVVGTHYPSDVVAGAALGTAAALLLWLPAIRRPLDTLSDWLAGLYDGLVEAFLGRLRRAA